MEQQEIMIRLSMLQQQAEQIEEKVKLVNQQINEIQELKEALDKLENSKNKEILANMGKGIFVNAELKNKELLVNVGNNILVKKTPEETKGVIEKQILQLEEIKNYFLTQLEAIQENLHTLVERAREEHSEEKEEKEK